MKDFRLLLALATLESDASVYQYAGDTVKLVSDEATPALATKTSMGFATSDKTVTASFKVEMSLMEDYNLNGDGKLATAGFDACLPLVTAQTVDKTDYGMVCFHA